MFASLYDQYNLMHRNDAAVTYHAGEMTRTIAMTPGTTGGPRATTATQPFAWQGWRMRVPTSWNAVRLEGDFAKGHALLADMDGPRLGLRWRAIKAKEVDAELLRAVIRAEAGDDAAKHAKPLPDPNTDLDVPWDHLLSIDRDLPGRDVFVKCMGSQRLVQLVYHARRRDDALRGEIIPSFADTSHTSMMPWAVLGLACGVPTGLRLTSHRLNLGDLSLEFGDGRRFVVVRQLALAHMALRRKPLAQWLAEQQRARGPRYRASGDASPIELTLRDGRSRSGLIGRMRRRLRFRSGECVTLALNDEVRDRLVLVEASDESLARSVAETVGCDIE